MHQARRVLLIFVWFSQSIQSAYCRSRFQAMLAYRFEDCQTLFAVCICSFYQTAGPMRRRGQYLALFLRQELLTLESSLRVHRLAVLLFP